MNKLPNAVASDDPRGIIYFLHIPKTGGTTFHSFISAQFEGGKVCSAHLWHQMVVLDPKIVGGCEFIWGHFYSYLHRYLQMPMRYITMLRHPLERALSHYAHVRNNAGHYFHRKALEQGTFSNYIGDPEIAPTLNSFQARSLTLH